MLHVLFNERPVPTLRKSCAYSRNEYYYNMAGNSLIKIDNPKIREFKNGTKDFYCETTHIKKAVWNSWAVVPITWKLAENYINNEEMFQLFVNELNLLLSINILSTPIMTIREKIRKLDKNKLIEFYQFIKEKLTGRTGFSYFFGIKESGELFKPDNSKLTDNNRNTGRTINNGIDTIYNLCGQIIVPVTENDVEKLKTSSKGFANLLDNGLVWIDSIKNENDVVAFGFIKVSEISLKMTQPNKQ
jgi:hypothetical protein